MVGAVGLGSEQPAGCCLAEGVGPVLVLGRWAVWLHSLVVSDCCSCIWGLGLCHTRFLSCCCGTLLGAGWDMMVNVWSGSTLYGGTLIGSMKGELSCREFPLVNKRIIVSVFGGMFLLYAHWG